MTEFELTLDHITLLRNANVRWEDCEFGAPAIDCKRPYGNSSVLLDVAEILGIEVDTDDDDYGISNETLDALDRLHRETETALQLILTTGSFEPGLYRKTDPYNSRSWEKIDG